MATTTDTAAFYDTLTARGHVLTTDSRTLNVSRGSELTPEEQDTIREHKPALMLLVLGEEFAELRDWLWEVDQGRPASLQECDKADRRYQTVIAMLCSLGWREDAA